MATASAVDRKSPPVADRPSWLRDPSTYVIPDSRGGPDADALAASPLDAGAEASTVFYISPVRQAIYTFFGPPLRHGVCAAVDRIAECQPH